MSYRQKNIYFTILMSIINLIVIWILKYYGNDLIFNDFSLFNLGNLLNFGFTLLLIVLCFLLLKKNSKISETHLRIINFLSILYLAPLLIALFFYSTDFEFAKKYFLGYPFKKIIPIIFLVLNQLIQFYVIFILIFFVLRRKLLLYVYAVIYVMILVVVLIGISFTNTYILKEFEARGNNEKFDYGIILGAAVWSNNQPSTLFMSRIDKGAELYLAEQIHKIHLTGGNAPGELSEAQSAYNYLMKKYKINDLDIIFEENTSTTNEQIRYIKTKFDIFKSGNNFLFISDKFHLKRISEMIKFYNLDAEVISSDYKLNLKKSVYYRIRESIALLLFWLYAI